MSVLKQIKKIAIAVLLIAITLENAIFADQLLNELKGKELDFTTTYKNLTKAPDSVYGGEFLVIGDSYAFLFSEYSNASFNYIVHQGYNIGKIYSEFLKSIKEDRYKYAFLLIGPNDFMEQTDLAAFKFFMHITIEDLQKKGMKVIVTDYCDPDYSDEFFRILQYSPNPCYKYDLCIKELISQDNLLYVPMSDLVQQYGRLPFDGVHPSISVYTHLLPRVCDKINEDMMGK